MRASKILKVLWANQGPCERILASISRVLRVPWECLLSQNIKMGHLLSQKSIFRAMSKKMAYMRCKQTPYFISFCPPACNSYYIFRLVSECCNFSHLSFLQHCSALLQVNVRSLSRMLVWWVSCLFWKLIFRICEIFMFKTFLLQLCGLILL